ncbi:calmodulin binding protein PICBP-like [Humulus lupulus]|uniref:calmodulin binding protein PICBP-like n=1 Tax=Humulus lupulus TaxID=3486 RepID=UPI002B40D026|nr:calmodulin binding protein PICBP-like [Humulus lupulus]
MVQRKVPDKLGIQADRSRNHDQKLLMSLAKPSSSQYQDGKKRGPDLKKKRMKKSKSFKLSDYDHQSLKSSSSSTSTLILKQVNICQPGKLPPQTVLPLPQHKQPTTIKTAYGSPNYMKSTSCFDARKGQQSQVSSLRNTGTSKVVTSASNNKKPVKSSNKASSSSKHVRTLTKTPNFKHSRPASAMRKSSTVALCTTDDVNVERPTCSSTLKDSMFPSYLTLAPGGTESDGSSIMKVCPYKYCSLNGHLHAPLPTFKCFLSARRRSLKTQKKMKVQALSPRKGKMVPSEEEVKKIETLQVVKLENEEAAENVGIDFFIEIYPQTKEYGEEKIAFVSLSTKGGNEEKVEEEAEAEAREVYIEKQVVEILSDGSPQSEIDTDESLGMAVIFSEEGNYYEDRDYSSMSEQEETEGIFSSESTFEVTDMEWEEGKCFDADLEDETDNSSENNDKYESISLCSLKILSTCDVDTIHDYELEVGKQKTKCFEGLAEENATQQEIGIQESGNEDLDQPSCTDDEYEDLYRKEEIFGEGGERDSMHIFMAATSTMRIKVDEAENIVNLTELTDKDSCNNLQDESKEFDETNGGKNGSHKTDESSETDEESDVLEKKQVFEEISTPDSSPEPNEEVAPKVEERINSGNLEQYIDQNQNTQLKSFHECEDQKQKNPPEMEEGHKNENEGKELENKTEQQKNRSLTTFLRLDQLKDGQEELSNWWNRSRRGVKDLEVETTGEINPREPNYLPVVADPDGEKIDLKHQVMDERKNSDEWMIDYALQQAVTKLAPARKRKVALLVEAFEAVTPLRHQHHHHHHPHSPAFPHATRPLQACS